MPANPIRAAQELCGQLDREMVQRAMDDEVFLEIGELLGGLSDKGLRHDFDVHMARIRQGAIDGSGCSLGGRGGNDPDSYYPEWLEKQIDDGQDDAARRFVADAWAIIERWKAQQKEAA